MNAIVQERPIKGKQPASTKKASRAGEESESCSPWCNMNHIDGHDGIEWRDAIDAPLC